VKENGPTNGPKMQTLLYPTQVHCLKKERWSFTPTFQHPTHTYTSISAQAEGKGVETASPPPRNWMGGEGIPGRGLEGDPVPQLRERRVRRPRGGPGPGPGPSVGSSRPAGWRHPTRNSGVWKAWLMEGGASENEPARPSQNRCTYVQESRATVSPTLMAHDTTGPVPSLSGRVALPCFSKR